MQCGEPGPRVTDVERRLRKLVGPVEVAGCGGECSATPCALVMRLVRDAARIGAEVEREECAVFLESVEANNLIANPIRLEPSLSGRGFTAHARIDLNPLADAIRARGKVD